MDIPGHGHVAGEWDLRTGIREYLGGVDLRGKRVLEMGTANGFVCFHMEAQGAEVVAYDLSEKQDWDFVPYARDDQTAYRSERRDVIRKLNNAFWFAHRALGSRSKMVYGDVYSVPNEIGAVDVVTFGSILLHLRDPFLALETAVRLAKETVIVTDILQPDKAESDPERDDPPLPTPEPTPTKTSAVRRLAKRVAMVTPVLNEVLADRVRLRRERDELLLMRDRLLRDLQRPRPVYTPLKFLPDWRTFEPKETWWHLSPEVVERFLGVLGFERTEVSYHTQRHRLGERALFTVVGHRESGPLR